MERKFSRALFARTTNRYGCVTLHHYHFYVERGLPKTPVRLWVYGDQVRAVFDSVVLAAYHGRYNPRNGKVSDLRDGVFYATRFAVLCQKDLPFRQKGLPLRLPETQTAEKRAAGSD